MSLSDKIALVSLIIAIAALLISAAVALYTVWRADKTASAGALIAIQVALSDAWEAFLMGDKKREEYDFAELLNLLETCCALYLNRSFTSAPRELLKTYLMDVFQHLAKSGHARRLLSGLAQKSDTFKNIAKFETENRASLSLASPLFIA